MNTIDRVFGVTDYNNDTLIKLHDALQANPDSQRPGTWEKKRLATVVNEMKRRGIRVERSSK